MDPAEKQNRLMLLLSHAGIQFHTDATGRFEQRSAHKHVWQTATLLGTVHSTVGLTYKALNSKKQLKVVFFLL